LEYLIEYALFLAKSITIVVVIFAIVSVIVAAGQRRRQGQRGNITGKVCSVLCWTSSCSKNC